MKETGDPTTSLQNAYSEAMQHGPLIGVIHRIHPDRTHSSLLFFHDGQVHTCTGLACGVEGDTSMLLKAVIQMIPTGAILAEGDLITKLGTESKAVSTLAEGKSVHYIFRGLNRKIGLAMPYDCPGMKAMQIAVQKIFAENDYVPEMLDILQS